jgi:hypothetical protein
MNGPRDFIRVPESLNPANLGMSSSISASSTLSNARDVPKQGYVRSAPRFGSSAIRIRSQSPTVEAPGAGAANDNNAGGDYSTVATAVLATLAPSDPCMRASPASLHFAGGFGANDGISSVLRALVRVKNVAPEAQRIYVAPVDASTDDGKYFFVESKNAGRVAPGLSRDFIVTFAPAPGALRYHYCSISVRGEWGALTIPVHAYPIASEFKFPKRIDMGRVALLDAAERRLNLTAGVPIDFDFSIDVKVPHCDISIEPTSGTIPAGGSLDVVITYAPSTLSTASCDIVVHAAQHNWKPLNCTISGSSHAGMRRDTIVLEGTSGLKNGRKGAVERLEQGGNSISNNNNLEEEEEEEGSSSSSSGVVMDGLNLTAREGYIEGKNEEKNEDKVPRRTSFSSSTSKLGMKRWVEKDAGLSVLDTRLLNFKESQELKLGTALQQRSVIVDALANAMHVATGADFTRDEASALIKATAGATASIDDFGDPNANSIGNFTVLGGVRVPAKEKLQQSDINFVLNQAPGRLLPSDIKRAVKAKRLQQVATESAKNRMKALVVRDQATARQGTRGGTSGRSPRGRSNGGEGGTARESRGTEGGLSTSSSPSKRPRSPRAIPATHNLVRRQGGSSEGYTLAVAISEKRRERSAAGPLLSPSELAAGELAASWLFSALQGARSSSLPKLLQVLISTPDHVDVKTGSMLDEVLGGAGAIILGSGQRSEHHRKDFTSDLPPALAALVKASASPLLDPRTLRESLFIQDTDDISQAEAHRETSNFPWFGELLLSRKAVSRVRRLRALLAAFQDVVFRRLVRTRRTTLAIPFGGLQAMSAVQAASAAASAASDAAQRAQREDARLAATLSGPMGEVARRKAADAVVAAEKAAEAAKEAARIAGSNPILGSSIVRAALLPLSKPVITAGQLAWKSPTFIDETGKDAWALRSDTLARFRHAVSARIARTRVTKRLALLRAKIEKAAQASNVDSRTLALINSGSTVSENQSKVQKALATTRVAVADVVDREHRRMQIEGRVSWVLHRPSKAELAYKVATGEIKEEEAEAQSEVLLFKINSNRINRTAFGILPVDDDSADGIAESTSTDALLWDRTEPLHVALPTHFSEVAPFEEPEWPEYEESGYTPFPVPSAPIYQPLEDERPLREGALHESAASGLFPLSSAQAITDPYRIGYALRGSKSATIPKGGFGLAAETLLAKNAFAEMLQPHPSTRVLPPSAPHLLSIDPATGLTESGATEAEAHYLLHPYQAMLEPFSSNSADMPYEVTGIRHAHAAGIGMSSPVPSLPGVYNAGNNLIPPSYADNSIISSSDSKAVSATGSGSGGGGGGEVNPITNNTISPSHDSSFGGISPLDVNGTLPTAGQIYSAQMGFSTIRSLEIPAFSAKPHPLLFSHMYTPSHSRPVVDYALQQLYEVAQPPPPPLPDGTPAKRLETDVTPIEKRIYSTRLLTQTRDLWAPPLVSVDLPLLTGPRMEDALSDDSESDPDFAPAEEEAAVAAAQALAEEAKDRIFSSSKHTTALRQRRGRGGNRKGEDSDGSSGYASPSDDVLNNSIQSSTSRTGASNLKLSGPSLEKARFLFLPKSIVTSIKSQGKSGAGVGAPEASSSGVSATGPTLPASNASTARESRAGGGSVVNDANTVKFSTAESVSAHSMGKVPALSLPLSGEHPNDRSVLLRSIGLDTSTFKASREQAYGDLARVARETSNISTNWLRQAGSTVNEGLSDPRRRIVQRPM